MKIEVLNRSLWDYRVCIKLGHQEDGEFVLDSCNHANTYTEEYPVDYPNPHGRDITRRAVYEICNGCGACREITYAESADNDWILP